MQIDFFPNYSIEYSKPLRTVSTHLKSGNSIITDAPTDNHGKGEAFSPTDLLSSSLISCVMTLIGIAADRDGVEIVSMTADVSKEMASSPRRVAKVSAVIHIKLHGANKESAKKLKRIGLECPVARSLSSDLVQDIKFNINLS
jgi:uncharacterized OsmC-like protein